MLYRACLSAGFALVLASSVTAQQGSRPYAEGPVLMFSLFE